MSQIWHENDLERKKNGRFISLITSRISSGILYPPGPRGQFIVGDFFSFLRQGPLEYFQYLFDTYGEIVRYPFLGGPRYLIANPDALHEIFHGRVGTQPKYSRDVIDFVVMKQILGKSVLTLEGSPWLYQRRLLSPAFDTNHLARYSEVFITITDDLLTRWRNLHEGAELDIFSEMSDLTLQNVCRTLFDINISSELQEIKQGTDAINHYFTELLRSQIPIPPRVPIPRNRRFLRGLKGLHATIDRIIAEYRQDKRTQYGDNLLTMLLSARDTNGASLSDETIRNELLTMLLAGHETTATLLTWSLYLIAQDAKSHDSTALTVERRLQDEVDVVLGKRRLTGEDLPRLVYTRMVLEESLRLYPPAWVTFRKALVDDTLCGYPVPKGTIIAISYPIVHHRTDLWGESANCFDPQRFSPERKASIPSSAYIPFISGPHRCIGEKFALQEATIALAMIVQSFRVSLPLDHPKVKAVVIGLLQPEPRVYLRLYPR
jgi:cytochrome P450